MKDEKSMDEHVLWHSMSADSVLKHCITVSSGLTHEEAKTRLKQHGLNRLPDAPKQSVCVRFMLQFHNILIYVLLASSMITALLGHVTDTVVILAVVVVNAIIGFIQEGKAEKAMDAIRKMLTLSATVIRNGERIKIPGEYLVPGDIVLLEPGDKVPADLRLLTAHNLAIQEAILTGESVPVEKQTKSANKSAPIAERFCIAYSGTLVTSGQGKGVVIATAKHTEIGRISDMLSEVKTLATPLVVQMNAFACRLTLFILTIAAFLIVYGYFVAHHDFEEMFMAVVGVSVAAIPEGLPAVLTITLAVGAQEMARRNAIVRQLPAIETLGSVSIICTDKTGTLTFNEMMVASVLNFRHLFSVEGTGYTPKGPLKLESAHVKPSEHSVLNEIALTATVCNDAVLRQHEGIWTVEGDPMEGSLLAFAGKMDVDVRKIQATWRRIDAIPFDSKYRFMATLNHDHDGNVCIFVKGAPEKILSMCHSQQGVTGGDEPLNLEYWHKKSEIIASFGQRVLAFAIKSVPKEQFALQHSDVEGSLTLLGMVGIIDPPRPEAIKAIAECHSAGIRVKMITGDHAKTAAAIAKQIGLHNATKILTGVDIDAMSDEALRQQVLDCDIFARTSPEHKLRLVTALQSHGVIVAMTGDGVNDAPALKRADVGIAMGKKGSEAAKEAAKLVLADDNFTSIVSAVREGRTVYDNIKKVISWTLPTNAGESLTIIVALFFGFTLPITPIQILWINLITAITLGLALSFDPPEENTMKRPPRPRNEPILGKKLLWHIVVVSLFFLCGVYGIYSYAIYREYSIDLARTLALNTIVIMEIFHLFFIRNIYNTSLTWAVLRASKFVWIPVIIISAAQVAITYFAPLQTIFATVAMSFWDAMLIIGIGAFFFASIEIEKQIRLRLCKKNTSFSSYV